MNIELLREYCLNKKGVTDSFPFDDNALVFKVLNKMFLIIPVNSNPLNFTAKCDPHKAVKLREEYESINPGYHTNKKHWNTIEVNPDINDDLIYELVNHSYDLVVSGLSKKDKENLESM